MNKNKPILLILDDDDAIRESLIDFFDDRGWLVIGAPTAEVALELIDEYKPNCALVDIRLPGMDGIDFLRIINQKQLTLSCIICTGSPEYSPPTDVLNFPQVSKRVFAKPITDLTLLEQALKTQLNHD